MRRWLQSALRLIRRVPFTLVSLVVLGVVALVTNSHLGELSSEWFERLAFAPRDLPVDWPRLITSALVTNGGWTFWGALGLIGLTTGAAEWTVGTRRAALTFWGVHLATLLLQALAIALPLRALGTSLGAAVYVARDVGPSAGAFGCLGLACSRLAQRWRWAVGGLVLAGLGVVFLLHALTQHDAAIVSASMAHLLAFPLGWLSSAVGRGRPFRRAAEQSDEIAGGGNS